MIEGGIIEPAEPPWYAPLVPVIKKLEDDTPIYLQPYHYAPKEQNFITEETQRMLERDIISPFKGPWAFHVVLIRKKGRLDTFLRRLSAPK
jgi:hypothetical protein